MISTFPPTFMVVTIEIGVLGLNPLPIIYQSGFGSASVFSRQKR